jgi:5-methylcytosine-specific restriction protein A
VAKYVAARANGVCEACGFEAPFHRPDGSPYLEIHHIHRLADDGPDDIMHVSAICPNCHREAHFGVNKDGFRDRLGIAVAEREREYALPNTAGTDGEAMGVVRLQNRKGGSHGSV